MWGASDGPANLPASCFNTAIANTPATGSVVSVTTAAQLTTALAAAACGQKITLQAGNSFSGNFTVPAVHCTDGNYLWIQSSSVINLPAEGARYSTAYNSQTLYAPKFGPCYSGVSSLPGRPTFSCPSVPGTYTAQVTTGNTTAAFTLSAGTSHVRFIGLEITRATGTGLVNDLVSVGDNGDVDHIIFDRCWFHGTELGDETNRGLRDNAASYFAVIDSYFGDIYCVSVAGACTDSKAIGGGTNTVTSTTETNIKIVNNFLEAAGENILHGGGASNTTPTGIEIRLNLMFKPLVWAPFDATYNGGYKGGHPVVVKNSFEFKNGKRLLVEGNMFVNTWAGFTQHGQSITFTPVNQSGGCSFCIDQDITFRYNWIAAANSFIDASISANAGFLAAGGNQWSIHDNVADDIGYCGVNSAYCPSSQSMVSQTTDTTITLASQAIARVTFNHNTLVYNSTSTQRNAIGVSGPTITSGLNESSITFTNNLVQSGFGTTNSFGGSNPANCANTGSGGAILIPECWQPYTFGNNCFVNNTTRTWPGINVTSVASYTAVFTNYNSGNGGNYVLAAGACKAAATDGNDIGANIPLLTAVLQGGSSIIQQGLFGSSWVNIPPSVWPPTASNGAIVPVKEFRIWDDMQKWQQIETSSGTYTWTGMDEIINTLITNPAMTVIYAFGATPKWAGTCSAAADPSTCLPGPTGSGFGGGAQCSNGHGVDDYSCMQVSDVASDGTGTDAAFQGFVNTLTLRYPNKITYYEAWNEQDAPNFWCQSSAATGCAGTAAGFAIAVRMNWDAYNIIKCNSPLSQVLSPSFHYNTALTWMHTYVTTSINAPSGSIGSCSWAAQTVTGAQTFDIVNVHDHFAAAEAFITSSVYANTVTEIANDSLPTLLFNDETGCHGISDCINQDTLASYIARSYALRASVFSPAVSESNWHQFDEANQVLQGNISGLAYNVIYSWLIGVTPWPYQVSGTIYSVPIMTANGIPELIAWDTAQNCASGCTTANHAFGSQFGFWQDLNGVVHSTTGGNGTAPLGLKPILLTPTSAAIPSITVNVNGVLQ